VNTERKLENRRNIDIGDGCGKLLKYVDTHNNFMAKVFVMNPRQDPQMACFDSLADLAEVRTEMEGISTQSVLHAKSLSITLRDEGHLHAFVLI